MKILRDDWFPILLGAIFLFLMLRELTQRHKTPVATRSLITDPATVEDWWVAPPVWEIPPGDEGKKIRYGRALIANTAFYLGPRGRVSNSGNGMNCQNCHLDAGTKPWGNNYSAVYATYPKFRERSGGLEHIPQRVNDCLQRSLNSQPIAAGSHEMQAIISYIKWMGQHVNKNVKPKGAGITDLPFLNRPADTAKGKKVFSQLCARCHGKDGFGLKDSLTISYIYPPLWGMNSYTTAAGLYRLSRFAGFVKDNMPFGASHHQSQLSTEEAWDVAAFVNSQPRPVKVFSKDWPNIAGKPFDHPFGPFADTFPEKQHKYGPFGPIARYREEQSQKNILPHQ